MIGRAGSNLGAETVLAEAQRFKVKKKNKTKQNIGHVVWLTSVQKHTESQVLACRFYCFGRRKGTGMGVSCLFLLLGDEQAECLQFHACISVAMGSMCVQV